MKDKQNKEYLGNGVYAERVNNFDIILRANDHRDVHCTDKIYLEDKIMEKLIRFYKEVYEGD